MTATATHYIRYSKNGTIGYGILEGDAVRELKNNFLHDITPTGTVVRISEVKLLAPCEPSKVIAVGRNYKSHLGERTPSAYPTVFLKLPSCIIGPEEAIVIPPGATDVHYEAELVVVIGKTASKVPKEAVASHIFGVTAGNDISERVWQKNDVQWFRAKASDTFGPLGPAIVQGLDYNDLLVQSRVNGEVRQRQRTCDMLFDVATMVSYISQFVTLFTGDVIYTGTPAQTRAMQPGDVVEVEIEGIGILRNPVR
jgi:2-keto-4-pentenoate hydratase/2-oxohepta-3-ene-1,7-dioic acid hydratase in catechol pathway